MLLADTAVWIDHLSAGNQHLLGLRSEGSILCHSYIMGKSACGNLQNRTEILKMLESLHYVKVAEYDVDESNKDSR
jgi:predicted nucleic acid-binding protein